MHLQFGTNPWPGLLCIPIELLNGHKPMFPNTGPVSATTLDLMSKWLVTLSLNGFHCCGNHFYRSDSGSTKRFSPLFDHVCYHYNYLLFHLTNCFVNLDCDAQVLENHVPIAVRYINESILVCPPTLSRCWTLDSSKRPYWISCTGEHPENVE